MRKGFTLVELMIVVSIISILAAVSAPRFGAQLKRAKDGRVLSYLGTWRSASILYYVDNEGVYASDIDNTDGVGEFVSIKTYEAALTAINTGDTEINYEAGSPSSIIISYESIDGTLEITTSSGVDTKGNNWNEY